MSRFVTVTRDSARDFVHIRYEPTANEMPEDVAELARDVTTQRVATALLHARRTP